MTDDVDRGYPGRYAITAVFERLYPAGSRAAALSTPTSSAAAISNRGRVADPPTTGTNRSLV